MVVFGDSLSDGGFFFGVRFTDPGGLLWHEYLADRLGQERAVTGFLGTSGLNLAVGGSLAGDLSEQVNRYKRRYTWQPGDLCTVWTGGNDIRGNPNGDMTAVAAAIGAAIAQLAAAGVDHFVVPNLPDLGAIPESLGDDTLSNARTTATMAFNNALAAELDTRAATLGVTIEQPDIFAIYDHILFYREESTEQIGLPIHPLPPSNRPRPDSCRKDENIGIKSRGGGKDAGPHPPGGAPQWRHCRCPAVRTATRGDRRPAAP